MALVHPGTFGICLWRHGRDHAMASGQHSLQVEWSIDPCLSGSWGRPFPRVWITCPILRSSSARCIRRLRPRICCPETRPPSAFEQFDEPFLFLLQHVHYIIQNRPAVCLALQCVGHQRSNLWGVDWQWCVFYLNTCQVMWLLTLGLFCSQSCALVGQAAWWPL